MIKKNELLISHTLCALKCGRSAIFGGSNAFKPNKLLSNTFESINRQGVGNSRMDLPTNDAKEGKRGKFIFCVLYCSANT